jgi:hypothetical protein
MADRRDGELENTALRPGYERTMTAAHLKIPRIDVDTASREKLIAHIDELEWVLDGILPTDAAILRLRDALAITWQQAAILSALERGAVITNRHLALSIGRFEDELAEATVKAQICKLRKRVERFGIKINVVWGVGYQLDAACVGLVRSIIDGEG